ncbi:MAG: glycosyl transferase [Desulfuromonas sp.]|nr:MAG: glycosyl transferase [Desulfuromonas sp.]
MSRIAVFLILVDFLIALVSGFVGQLIVSGTPLNAESLQATTLPSLWFALAVVLSSALCELYVRRYCMFDKGVLPRVVVSFFLVLTVLGALGGGWPVFMGMKALLVALLLFCGLQYGLHSYSSSILGQQVLRNRVLILGTGRFAAQLTKTLNASSHRYFLVGFVKPRGELVDIDAGQILGDMDDLLSIAQQQNIHKIIIALEEQRGVLPVADLLRCRFGGIDVVDAVTFYEEMTGKVHVKSVNPGWFIYSTGFELDLLALTMKRAADITFSLVGIALTWPLMLLVALAVRLDSPGPILFRQVRVGKNEEVFELFKFRTMVEDAEAGTGAVWAQQNDPRVTRIGCFLRKTRLDELPQFFNVLKGDMAFVGPRPERPEFVLELYQLLPYYAKRHALKPGVTGWAQINYPYGASVDDALEKLNYDLYYIKNYSVFLDILIVMETVQVVLLGKGGR